MAAIETVITLPIVLFMFFAALQLILVMVNSAALKSAVGDVVGTYETMFIKDPDNLNQFDVKDIICEKMVMFGDCEKNTFVQLHSYEDRRVSDIQTPMLDNKFKGLDSYYVSFVRVDYKMPNLIPFFPNLMRSSSDDFLLSSTFIISPSKVRFDVGAGT